MTQVRFEIKGIENFRRKLELLDKKAERVIGDEIKKSGLNVETDAKIRCPVDSGRLRSSIRTTYSARGLVASVFTDVIYSKFVEFGTVRMIAQPFLFPAWERERPHLLDRLRTLLRNIN